MQSLTKGIGSIFQPLLKLVADILAFFYSVIPSYPIDVALLTIVIMAALTPLTVKSTKNMAAMQALGPEMKKLQQKYKGAENRVQLNEEMMKLYKEHKVNPASGCLPMLLQMPAFLILYDVIRGITNTVTKGGHVVADPRYIGHNTKMYTAITQAKPPGSLNAFGMNFAQKLLSHHNSWYLAIPFLLLVGGSVGLQYLQMSRLNARNPQAAQANPQAAMMQKYMPLIFGLIYLNVAAIINVYFIVSSAIRIATQEVLFRKGIVAGPPSSSGGATKAASPKGTAGSRTERELPKPKAASKPGSTTNAAGGGGSKGSGRDGTEAAAIDAAVTKATDKPTASSSRGGGSANRSRNASNRVSNEKSMGSRPGQPNNRSNGSTGGGDDGSDANGAKEHPRSKSKRERKDR